MFFKRYSAAVLLTLMLAVSALAAQKIDTALQHVQLQIVIPSSPPQTWWDKLRALLGARAFKNRHPDIGSEFTVESTAYASSPYQTDSTPCVTAAGTRVRPGVVASNFFPLGTLLSINGQKYVVEDRMNSRYDDSYLDIWLTSTEEALNFGRRKLEVTVIGYTEPGSFVRDKNIPTVGFWQRVGSFLGARVGLDVNQNDVAC